METVTFHKTKKDLGLYNCYHSFVIRGIPKLTQQLCLNNLVTYEMVGYMNYKKHDVSVRTFVFSNEPMPYTLLDSVDYKDCYTIYNKETLSSIIDTVKTIEKHYVCNIIFDNIIKDFKDHEELVTLELRKRNTGVNLYFLVEDNIKIPKALQRDCDRFIQAPDSVAFIEKEDIEFKQFYLKNIEVL